MPPTRKGIGMLLGLWLAMTIAATGLASSPPGLPELGWDTHVSEQLLGVTSVTFGQGRFVAASVNGELFVSTDARSWERVHAEPISREPALAGGGVPGFLTPALHAVVYGDGRFVAVGKPFFLVLTSVTGATWDFSYEWQGERHKGATELRDVTFGGGRFVAVGNYGVDSQAITSTDGITWRHSEVLPDTILKGVAYNGAHFVAVGQDSSGRGVVIRSSNGVDWTWTDVKLPPLRSVVFSHGQFFAVGAAPDGGPDTYVFTSGDGLEWRGDPAPGGIATENISAADSFLFLHGIGTDHPSPMAVSRDGTHWITVMAPVGLSDTAAGDGSLVTVGWGGTILTMSPCVDFFDFPESDPACQAVRRLFDDNIIAGYPDGTFRPGAPVTRGEVAKMLTLTVGQAPLPGAAVAFPDTVGHWAAEHGFVQAAVAMNAVNGYPDGTFRADDPVTRAELVKMVVSAAGMAVGNKDVSYTDVTELDWFVDSVAEALGANVIGTHAVTPVWTGAALGPGQPASRIETVAVLANLAEWLVRTPAP